MKYPSGSFFKQALDSLAGKANTSHVHAIEDTYGLQTALDGKQDSGSYAAASHTHTVSQITDFNDAVDSRISNIVGAAPAALDTLAEIAAALGDDEDFAGTMTAALSGKVDKVTGKGLSQEDFTTTLKNKLDALPDNATLQSALTAITNRLTDLENWKADMPKKSKRFTGTTDANGDVTIDLTSAGFTAAPSIGVTYVFNNNNYGTHYNVKSLSSTSVQLRVMRNKETSVLLGGSIDPDEPLASTEIVLRATEY